jgi:hypothetical protein
VTSRRAPLRALSLLPSLGVALMSKFTCSICVGSYTGLLGSLGLAFVATDAGLTGLTATLLTLGLAATAWSTRQHGHLGPIGLMLLGSGVLIVARLMQPSPSVVLTAGAVVTLGASVWNLRLEARRPCRERTEWGR